MVKRSRKRVWIIGIANSVNEEVFIERVYGSKEKVKKYLIRQAAIDRENNKANWVTGTESSERVKESNGALYAVGCYKNYKVLYSAVPEKRPKTLF